MKFGRRKIGKFNLQIILSDKTGIINNSFFQNRKLELLIHFFQMRQRSSSGNGMGGMVDEADVDNLGANNGPPRLKRSLSEVREGTNSTPNAFKNKLRAGLRSPIKRQRHQSEPPSLPSTSPLTNGLTPSTSTAASAEPVDVPMPPSPPAKIVPVTADDISPDEPPGKVLITFYRI